MAALEGDTASAGHRTRVELADDLEIVAECLEELRSSLCPDCRAIELVESVAIEQPRS
ncbi:hypothetical protein HY251_16540 [bacterium]|nr:hypothetical protein [bacterium]